MDAIMSDESQNYQKRKHIRYPAENLEVAYVQHDEVSKIFQPDCVGLIVEQSAMGGCCLALTNTSLGAGDKCRVKIGQLNDYLSEVIWKKDIEKGLSMVGIKFLE